MPKLLAGSWLAGENHIILFMHRTHAIFVNFVAYFPWWSNWLVFVRGHVFSSWKALCCNLMKPLGIAPLSPRSSMRGDFGKLQSITSCPENLWSQPLIGGFSAQIKPRSRCVGHVVPLLANCQNSKTAARSLHFWTLHTTRVPRWVLMHSRR